MAGGTKESWSLLRKELISMRSLNFLKPLLIFKNKKFFLLNGILFLYRFDSWLKVLHLLHTQKWQKMQFDFMDTVHLKILCADC